MQYIFELTSKVQESVSHEEKHRQVIEGLQSIPKPWGITNNDYPAPDFGTGITATFRINKVLGSGIKGDIIYGYREKMASQNEDKIYIEFTPKKIDFTFFISNVFKKYIEFFKPYEASVYNQDVIFYDYGNRDKVDLSTFFRFHQIFFWDEEYCMRNLKISLFDLKAKISEFVEYSELFLNGIIVIVSSKPLTLSESNEIDSNLKSLFHSY
jgi:hypothetical protein